MLAATKIHCNKTLGDIGIFSRCTRLVLFDRLGRGPRRPTTLFIWGSNTQGVRAVGEREPFNAKAPVCGGGGSTDFAASMLEVEIPLLQDGKR